MQLTPRYDGPPVLVFDLPTGDPSVPLLRQRARLADTVAGFTAEQWAAPTRCEGWTAQDVITHLTSTNQFWAFSIGAGRGGQPTRFLATFDPVTSPAQLVDKARGQSTAELLEEFVASNAALAASIDGLSAADWATVVAEAPPGHIPLAGVALHALWDSWVHERDILLPQGLPAVEDADEITGCLTYGAGLGPMFLACAGSTRTGAYVIDGSGPDVRCVVELGTSARVHTGDAPDGALQLTGSSVYLLEALSARRPLDAAVDPADAWMLGGLATVFDQAD
jgi:uncharacterized protein (TIGR03083 family)